MWNQVFYLSRSDISQQDSAIQAFIAAHCDSTTEVWLQVFAAFEARSELDALRTHLQERWSEIAFIGTLTPLPSLPSEQWMLSVTIHSNAREKQLKQQVQALQQYEAAVNETFIVSKSDLYGSITYANPQFEKISGFSQAELIGRNHNIIRHPDNPSEVYQELWQTIQHKQTWTGVLTNRAKDGSDYTVRTRIVPILNEQGETREYVSLREDITEQERQKELLHLERERVQNMLDNQKSLVVVTDIERREIQAVNRSFLQFVGFDSLVSFQQSYQCICDLFLAEEGYLQKWMHNETWFDYVIANPQIEHRCKMPSPQGDAHVFSISISALDDSEKLLVSNFYDITELEEERCRAVSAEMAQAQFLANMSHELRTPINGIMGFSDLLESTDLNPEQQGYVEILRSSSRHLLSVVNDILDFSKIERGEITLDKRPEQVFVDLEKILLPFVSVAESKSVQYLMDLDPEMPECLLYDRVRLQQVLSNLISNAMKFTPLRGVVKVSVSLVEKQDSVAKIKFSVRDNGIGIAPDKQSEIFESFKQANNSTTRDYGGTGLGLSIANQLVAAMGGGRIELLSEEGEGADFWFTLTLEMCSSYPVIADVLKQQKVAVVSDSSPLQASVLRHLKSWGINYQLIDSPESAPECQVFLILNAQQWQAHSATMHSHAVYLLLFDGPVEESDVVRQVFAFEQNHSALYNALQEAMPTSTLAMADETVSFTGKILLAEDNEINRTFMQEIFKHLDLNADIAVNGLEAVKLYQNGEYDLVLMDINMPVMDGEAALMQLQQWAQEQHQTLCPVVALTANVIESQVSHYAELGFYTHLAKPLELDKLRSLLATLSGQTVASLDANHQEAINLFSVPNSSFKLQQAVDELQLPEEIYLELFAQALMQVEQELPDLMQAIEQEDYAQIYRVSHHLFGSCGNLRITPIAELLSAIDNLARADDQAIEQIKALAEPIAQRAQMLKNMIEG